MVSMILSSLLNKTQKSKFGICILLIRETSHDHMGNTVSAKMSEI